MAAAQVLPLPFLLAGWLALGWLAASWVRSGDWRQLTDPARLNLWLGATVVLLGLWQIRVGVGMSALMFHLYGMAALTLMVGFWRATLSGVLLLGVDTLLGYGELSMLGFQALLTVALPAWVSWNVYRIADRRLPNHFFVYVLVCGFFGAALAMALTALGLRMVLTLSPVYTLDGLFNPDTPYVILLASWAEAFTSGMVITLMAAYRPDWLETFDDARYVQNK